MFKNNLRVVRQAQGISMSRLARKAGIAESALSDIELGKRLPWPKARGDLSKLLGVPESELFPAIGDEDG